MTFIKATNQAQTCKNNNDLLQLLKQLTQLTTQLKAEQIDVIKYEAIRTISRT